MNPNRRRVWSACHRWIGLSAGVLLALTALLGALLVVARPLDEQLHPGLFAQPVDAQPIAAPLAHARERLQREFGPGAAYTFRPPRRPDDTLWVMVRGPWQGTVYFDAAGRELGRRGEHEGWFNLLFELHSALLLGDRGKAVLATAAAAYLLLLASGLVLWWPRRWPPSLRVAWRGAGALRAAFDLHKSTGALVGLLITVSVASGAYMAWPPLRTGVTRAAGERPLAPPRLPPGAAAGAPAPLDAMVAAARARFPQAMVGYVQVAGRADAPVRVRLKTPDDPHPNGLSSVWLHPGSGAILQVARWDALDAGNRLVTTVYPLHIGTLGGPLHATLTALTGLALASLGGTGLFVWWRRRAARGVRAPGRDTLGKLAAARRLAQRGRGRAAGSGGPVE